MRVSARTHQQCELATMCFIESPLSFDACSSWFCPSAGHRHTWKCGRVEIMRKHLVSECFSIMQLVKPPIGNNSIGIDVFLYNSIPSTLGRCTSGNYNEGGLPPPSAATYCIRLLFLEVSGFCLHAEWIRVSA